MGPQGAYGGLTDADALDIANYIKSLPPAVNFIADMCTVPPLPPSDAEPAKPDPTATTISVLGPRWTISSATTQATPPACPGGAAW